VRPEQFRRVRELFERASDLPTESRSAFLQETCPEDTLVRGQVERLLGQQTDAAVFQVVRGALDEAVQASAGGAVDALGSMLDTDPPYRLLRRIGEGGMGVVYEAEQESPVRRKVALKLIRGGQDSQQVIARFESERQALALMNHPNIASVYQAGATGGGRPFFAMELVYGSPVTHFCDEHRLPLRDRLELFIRICDGVQHAHQKGVIHRDIKPSNVLVAMRDGSPVPKIIDFGVAKATTRSLTERGPQTEVGQLLGTPEYMSPEQAEMANLDIDTRTDVYSLGVVLYELLAGTLPFQAPTDTLSVDEVRRRVREEDPKPPSVRAPQLKGDLDWITLKALEKDRNRRYETANALALDLRRHLDDEPVRARAPSRAYTIHKFVRRHRMGVSAASLAGLAILAGTVLATLGLIRARAAERQARAEAAKAVAINQFLQETLGSAHPVLGRGRDTTVLEALGSAVEKAEKTFLDQPTIHASLLNTVGRTYLGLGRYEEAQAVLGRALEMRRRTLGTTHPEVAESLASLGSVMFSMGRYAEAEPLFRQGLEINRVLHHGDHLAVAEALNDVAMTLQRKNRDYKGARPLLEESVAIRTRLLGERHPDIAQGLNNLAMLYYRMKDFDRAEPMFRRAIAMNEELLGPQHPELSTSWSNLALLLRDKGALGEAEALFRKVLEIDRRALGEDHPYVAAALRAIADLRLRAGAFRDAEPLYRQALAIQVKKFAEGHFEIAKTRSGIAACLIELGQYAEAESMLLESLADLRRGPGDEDAATQVTLRRIVELYGRWRKPEKADPYRTYLRD
jgi:serine/threonine protein kinase/Tfp pilus assembly protein PilF